MSRFSCFVTGTDTGIGKTLTTCALICRLARQGLAVAGMKPVAAGAMLHNGQWHNEDTDAILRTANVSLPPEKITPCLLQEAASPHISAQMEKTAVSWPRIRDCYTEISQQADAVIVEGVGGFMAPLSEHDTVADLAVQFGLPVILVVGLRLGCLNHALLTAESILSRNLRLAGWIANCIDPAMRHGAENITLLEQRIPAPRLATIPYIRNASAREAANFLDLSPLF